MKVYYKRLIEGITIPAIIHNGGYYYHNMPVYEDGSIDCWRRVPLNEHVEKFKEGWLVTFVPKGKTLSIHGLATIVINHAQ